MAGAAEVVGEVGQGPTQFGVGLEAEADDGAVFAGLVGERTDPDRQDKP
jgi:hypothetical protein